MDLLQAVFGELAIPRAVYDEVVIAGAGRSGSAEVAELPWIMVRTLNSVTVAVSLRRVVDSGEAEAIALALEIGAGTLVLLDDQRARWQARRLGLPVRGSAGVLLLAKELGIVPQVRPLLDQLYAVGLRLTADIYHEIISAANEEGERIP